MSSAPPGSVICVDSIGSEAQPEHPPAVLWVLSGRPSPESSAQEVSISAQPFTIGRGPENNLCLSNSTVSGEHAELLLVADHILVKDLDSTNGTLVNGRRVEGAASLADGDTLHFGTAMFKLRRRTTTGMNSTVTANIAHEALAQLQFDKLLNSRALLPFYQPIVRLDTLARVGYEVLARSRLVGLESPENMFRVAAERGSEAVLSGRARQLGLQFAGGMNGELQFYLNTHPVELDEGLFDSLKRLRAEFPHAVVVLEVHEAAVTSSAFLAMVRERLSHLNMTLAYDDFGAGQARLMELVEVPPDILKFDRSLIHGISEASPQRIKTVGSLVAIVRELDVTPLAEGIETEAEAAVCRELGFQLAQGYLFGRPAPAKAWSERIVVGGASCCRTGD